MPFSRPTLTELRDQVAADINGSVPGAEARLRFGNLGVMGRAQAGLAHGHWGYLDWIARMAVPFTAEGEFLEGWAALKGVYRKAATAASGSASFTGNNGLTIPAGRSVVRADGMTYTTAADATVSGGSAVVVLTADDVGAAGNADVGTAMTLAIAIAGINSTGQVSVALTGGADVETDDALRSRMLQVYASPPQGGSKGDYIAWALAVPGVTRAWVKNDVNGPGTVGIWVMLDVAQAAHNGFPQGTDGVAADESRDTAATGDQLTVANALHVLQPVTALVYVFAPQPDAKNFSIANLSGASLETKAAIAAAIDGVFMTYGEADGGTVELSYIEAAIAAIPGTTGFILTPNTNLTTAVGYLPVRGTVTYT